MPRIRIRVAGIYIRENQILLVKHRKANREYYLLPGGGQETGETATDALIREWKEELNLDIKPGKFLFCGESVPPRQMRKSQLFQVVFQVDEIEGEIDVTPDGALAGYTWMPLEKLGEIAFFPACLEQVRAYIENNNLIAYQRYKWLR